MVTESNRNRLAGPATNQFRLLFVATSILVKTREFVQRKAVTVGNGNWTVLGNDF